MESTNYAVNIVSSCAPALNYYRVAKLTLVEGTAQVRNCVLSHLPSSSPTLHTALELKRNHLRKLYNSRIISEKQWRLLYPENQNADMTFIDLGLWVVLLRNITRLQSRNINWNEAPGPDQTEWFHDVLRIKETRNNLSHLTRPELDADSFEALWNETTTALRRLNGSIDFEQYFNTPLDREALRAFHQQVNEQVLQEKNSVLQHELTQRQKMFYVVVVGLISIIVVVIAAVVALVVVMRDTKPCSAFLTSQEMDGSLVQVIPRDGWTRRAPGKELVRRNWPSQYVFYTHTADTAKCHVIDDCCARLRNIQDIQMFTQHNWSDIAFHYIIDSNGVVYLGRQPNIIPAAVLHYNNLTISVAIIGDYNYWHPSDESIASLEHLLNYVTTNKWVTANYTLLAMCEVRNFDSPGVNLYKKVNDIYNQCNSSLSIARRYREICRHLKYGLPNSSCPLSPQLNIT